MRPSALGKGWVSRSPQGSSPPITSLVLQRSSSWHSDPHLPRSAPTRECERGAAWGASRGAGRPAGQSVQGRGSFPASLCRSLLPRCCCRRLPGPPGADSPSFPISPQAPPWQTSGAIPAKVLLPLPAKSAIGNAGGHILGRGHGKVIRPCFVTACPGHPGECACLLCEVTLHFGKDV